MRDYIQRTRMVCACKILVDCLAGRRVHSHLYFKMNFSVLRIFRKWL
jgi:hypothetical protein